LTTGPIIARNDGLHWDLSKVVSMFLHILFEVITFD